MEMTTDPIIFGWRDAAGEENGDKCSYNYGPLNYAGGLANESWNGHFYVLQQEWDNATSSCVQGVPVPDAPSPPTLTATYAGNTWASVAFTTPAISGSGAVTSLTVTASPGGATTTVTASSQRALLTGLTNGITYTLTVTATNNYGTSAPSNSRTATPTSANRNVTTNWNASEYPRLVQTANYLAVSPQQAQRTSVYTIAFIVGIVNPASPSPITPAVSSGPNAVTTAYSIADQGPLTTVMRQYGLSPSESQYFATQLVGFLFALGGH
jgi:large repetitive protein